MSEWSRVTPGPRHWTEIEPVNATDLELTEGGDIIGPRNEEGEVCPWPWEPQQLKGVPLGQYHCQFCGAMVIAGTPHVDYTEMSMSNEHEGDAKVDSWAALVAKMRETAETEMGNEPMKAALREGAEALREATEELRRAPAPSQGDEGSEEREESHEDVVERQTLDAVYDLFREHDEAGRKTIKVEDLAKVLHM